MVSPRHHEKPAGRWAPGYLGERGLFGTRPGNSVLPAPMTWRGRWFHLLMPAAQVAEALSNGARVWYVADAQSALPEVLMMPTVAANEPRPEFVPV